VKVIRIGDEKFDLFIKNKQIKVTYNIEKRWELLKLGMRSFIKNSELERALLKSQSTEVIRLKIVL